MIRYMVKNNIKLMSRSSINILLMIVMPLIVISVLSSAFTDLMKRYDESDITAGYFIENDAVNEKMIDALKEAAKDNGIILREYTRSDPAECMRNDDLNGFVVFDKDGYTVYRNSDEAEIGKVIEYFVNAFYEKTGTSMAGIDTDSIEIRVEHPAFKPSIESIDYYGIVEVVFFLWCAIVCGSGIFMSEKKYQIIKKYQVSNLSSTKLYLGKFIPLVAAVFAGGIISTVLSIVLLGVHWGRPLLSLIIILLTTGAASAFGLMVYNIFDNIVVTIIAVFTVVWFAGFYGGSFETYIYSSHPESIKLISPIYHINRALTELSCMGHSDFVKSAVMYNVSLVIICSLIAIAADALRKRGRA
ncbi:MAG: ABC transporter permease [Lachnospiraceae bacterium]|nr:ABC transporter permease [Lachnospiraceae bacterium]